MKTRKAIYAGSFDPLTNGHLWIIERAANLFDELIIAIGENPDKNYFLSTEERKSNIIQAIKTLGPVECQIEVEVIKNQFLATYAQQKEVPCLVRGIRSEGDFSYEYAMAVVNQRIDPNVDSIYLMPPPRLAQVSSSLVKSMIGPEGWQQLVAEYVPEGALQSLRKKMKTLT